MSLWKEHCVLPWTLNLCLCLPFFSPQGHHQLTIFIREADKGMPFQNCWGFVDAMCLNAVGGGSGFGIKTSSLWWAVYFNINPTTLAQHGWASLIPKWLNSIAIVTGIHLFFSFGQKKTKISFKHIYNCILWNCSFGEDSWESFGMQGDQTSHS